MDPKSHLELMQHQSSQSSRMRPRPQQMPASQNYTLNASSSTRSSQNSKMPRSWIYTKRGFETWKIRSSMHQSLGNRPRRKFRRCVRTLLTIRTRLKLQPTVSQRYLRIRCDPQRILMRCPKERITTSMLSKLHLEAMSQCLSIICGQNLGTSPRRRSKLLQRSLQAGCDQSLSSSQAGCAQSLDNRPRRKSRRCVRTLLTIRTRLKLQPTVPQRYV